MITEKLFFEAYNAYPPNKAQVFFYRYFGSTKEPEDNWLSNRIIGFWVASVFAGIFATAFQWMIILKILLLMFVFTFVPFWIFALIMVVSNNLRLRKVRDILGLSWREYQKLANRYL